MGCVIFFSNKKCPLAHGNVSIDLLMGAYFDYLCVFVRPSSKVHHTIISVNQSINYIV